MSAQVPSNLVAGDTWAWTSSFADYPASTWALTFYFQNESTSFSVASSASDDDFAAAKLAADTASLEPGRYRWRARVSFGANVVTIEEGWTDVEPDPGVGLADLRSDARKILDAINAFLIGNASTAQASMSLNGRSVSRWSLVELRQWRDQLRAEVETEERGEKAGLSRQLRTRLFRA